MRLWRNFGTHWRKYRTRCCNRAHRRLASWSFVSTVMPNNSEVSSPSNLFDKLQIGILPELIISSKSTVDFNCSRICLAEAENKNRPILAVIPAAIFTFCISPALPNSFFQKLPNNRIYKLNLTRFYNMENTFWNTFQNCWSNSVIRYEKLPFSATYSTNFQPTNK